jgi:hypothetical protein
VRDIALATAKLTAFWLAFFALMVAFAGWLS